MLQARGPEPCCSVGKIPTDGMYPFACGGASRFGCFTDGYKWRALYSLVVAQVPCTCSSCQAAEGSLSSRRGVGWLGQTELSLVAVLLVVSLRVRVPRKRSQPTRKDCVLRLMSGPQTSGRSEISENSCDFFPGCFRCVLLPVFICFRVAYWPSKTTPVRNTA